MVGHIMRECAVPISLPCCAIDRVTVSEATVKIKATLLKLPGICPTCQSLSRHVHGYYWRQLHDLPIWHKRVTIELRVRRFVCKNPRCQQQTYAQRCPTLTQRYQRMTGRLQATLYHVGQELGGNAGKRLAEKLSMSTSRDTLLRLVRRLPDADSAPVRVLGIDDWAMRKGHRYGTILVDLEAHRVIDLLPNRTTETAKAWLAKQPQLRMVARDRSREYARAITEACPSAIQVADRWHLLKNLREATERALLEIYPTLRQRTKLQTHVTVGELRQEFPRSALDNETRQEAKRKRIRRFELCHYLSANGLSTRRIASLLGISRTTVNRYLSSITFPERQHKVRRVSILDPFLPYMEHRFRAGCHNAIQLWREIVSQGYPGSPSQVRKWTRWRRQQSSTAPAANSIAPFFTLPAASELVKLLLSDCQTLNNKDKWLLNRVIAVPEIAHIYAFATRFQAMIRERDPTRFDTWIADMHGSKIRSVDHFVRGIKQDYPAIRAALTYSWSNGQTEGQVNRLKLLKRQMYGRAKLDLLKKRLTYRP